MNAIPIEKSKGHLRLGERMQRARLFTPGMGNRIAVSRVPRVPVIKESSEVNYTNLHCRVEVLSDTLKI